MSRSRYGKGWREGEEMEAEQTYLHQKSRSSERVKDPPPRSSSSHLPANDRRSSRGCHALIYWVAEFFPLAMKWQRAYSICMPYPLSLTSPATPPLAASVPRASLSALGFASRRPHETPDVTPRTLVRVMREESAIRGCQAPQCTRFLEARSGFKGVRLGLRSHDVIIFFGPRARSSRREISHDVMAHKELQSWEETPSNW